MRFIAPLLASVLLAGSLATHASSQPSPKGKNDPDPVARMLKDPQVKRAFDRINEMRKVAGLEPVELDAEASDGCRKHSAYIVLNWGSPQIAGLKAHEEVDTLKGASPEGAKAGKSSVIHYVPPAVAVDGWIATLYHRVPMLQPDLKKIGIGYAIVGVRAAVCIETISGVDINAQTKAIVLYPADGQKNVPLAFGGEVPDPRPDGFQKTGGFPITASFFGGSKVENAKLVLTAKGAGGKVVTIPGHLSTPAEPATSFTQWNTVCFISRLPLPRATAITAELTAEVDGEAMTKSWTFTTGR